MKPALSIHVRLLLLALFLAASYPVAAQKVALVLSGGGAKGLAHIGVIRALEENGIPIDYIAGTSMGAIIGGLYASGYSTSEIEGFVNSAEFGRWARGGIEEDYVYYMKKQEDNASWIKLRFNYDDTDKKLHPRLPTNVVSPYVMDFSILEYYASAAAASGYDFDSLFLPFRCVASDITAKKAVVLKNGQLGNAIRASMTYPFYFKPIEIDGKILFDGGLYDNFPVGVAEKEFSPDFIIGSKAVGNYKDPRMDDILSQIQNMIVEETDYSMPEENAILIEHLFPAVNVIDFSNKEEYIESGYQKALSMMDQIKASVSRRVTVQELEDRRQAFALKKPVMDIDSISIEGLSTSQQEYVNRLLIRPGGDLPLENLKAEYFKLLADDKIKYVFPTLHYDAASDHTTLCLKITRSEQFEAEFGGNIASNASTTGFVGLRYHLFDKVGYTVSGNGYFGRFYSSAKIETRLDVASRFPFFISAEFTYNHKDYFKNSTYFFEDKQPTFLLQNESHGGIVVGIPASAKGRIQGGVYTGYTKDNYYQTNQFTREDTTDRSYFDFWAPQISFELNNLDKKQYASAGSRLLISLKYITGKEKTIAGSTSLRTGEEFIDYHHWIQFRLVYDNYFQNFKFLKLGFYGDILLSNQPVFSNYTETILRTPAFEPLPDMKSLFLANYRSTNYAALGLKALFPIYRRVGFRLEGYLYQPYEELTRDEVTGEAVMQKAFSYRSAVANGVLVYDSPIGPISLSAMYLDRDEQSWYFLFNIGYVIFNRSALE